MHCNIYIHWMPIDDLFNGDRIRDLFSYGELMGKRRRNNTVYDVETYLKEFQK